LLSCQIVADAALPEVTPHARLIALQQLLSAAAAALGHSSSTASMHRALLHAYLVPAPTQLLAAERAAMSFGTFRRRLAAGLEELATTLFLREAELRAKVRPAVTVQGSSNDGPESTVASFTAIP
jgi:hypothetical protein